MDPKHYFLSLGTLCYSLISFICECLLRDWSQFIYSSHITIINITIMSINIGCNFSYFFFIHITFGTFQQWHSIKRWMSFIPIYVEVSDYGSNDWKKTWGMISNFSNVTVYKLICIFYTYINLHTMISPSLTFVQLSLTSYCSHLRLNMYLCT